MLEFNVLRIASHGADLPMPNVVCVLKVFRTDLVHWSLCRSWRLTSIDVVGDSHCKRQATGKVSGNVISWSAPSSM